VHELSLDQPNTTKELLDIATRHASGEEAVGAILVLENGKRSPAAAGRHHPKPPTNALRKAPRTTRKQMTLTRSTSRLLSVTSSTRRSS
jgi:hypothetical protein